MAITHRTEEVGAFSQKPPHYATLTALVDELGQGSVLPSAEGWLEDTDPNHTAFMTKLTKFMRLCERASGAAEERLMKASGIVGTAAEQAAEAKRKKDEELKNHAANYLGLEKLAEKYYNQSMLAECCTETVVKTHIQLEMHRLVLARLGSGKYGQKRVHFSESTLFKEDSNHHLVVASDEEKVPLYRNASVLRQIGQTLTSMVIAGCFEIDPIAAHLAGRPLWKDLRGHGGRETTDVRPDDRSQGGAYLHRAFR